MSSDPLVSQDYLVSTLKAATAWSSVTEDFPSDERPAKVAVLFVALLRDIEGTLLFFGIFSHPPERMRSLPSATYSRQFAREVYLPLLQELLLQVKISLAHEGLFSSLLSSPIDWKRCSMNLRRSSLTQLSPLSHLLSTLASTSVTSSRNELRRWYPFYPCRLSSDF